MFTGTHVIVLPLPDAKLLHVKVNTDMAVYIFITQKNYRLDVARHDRKYVYLRGVHLLTIALQN